MRTLYMVVDPLDKDLPQFVSFSAREVADFAGVSLTNMLSAITHAEQRGSHSRFVRIRLEDDDELIAEEDAHIVSGLDDIGEYIGILGHAVRYHMDDIPMRRIGNRWQAEMADLDEWMKSPPEWYTKYRRRKNNEIDRHRCGY